MAWRLSITTGAYDGPCSRPATKLHLCHTARSRADESIWCQRASITILLQCHFWACTCCSPHLVLLQRSSKVQLGTSSTFAGLPLHFQVSAEYLCRGCMTFRAVNLLQHLIYALIVLETASSGMARQQAFAYWKMVRADSAFPHPPFAADS